ncbi:MAG: hypothetical protein A2857_00855 [Candidatus Levybacteria bacterium RIFCSPHIGHO2_01_FULL_36_15]|nr:MAG: hypothetical protein A2857_00855 [Candidatus Levybacteria bacterium RIFCSPHIGHO2_01_FULL_36_15]OGH39108.1 MAG: hypothetical protein A2905_06460 [Candidatus Levybacteria bacterium RIFCSPLOWO2_01_FULL_36_10]
MFKSLLYISALTTFIVLAWIVSNIYHNTTSSTISEDTNIRTAPITPSFDTKAIDLLNTRQNISVDLKTQSKEATSASKPTTPTPTLSITPQTSTITPSLQDTNIIPEESIP